MYIVSNKKSKRLVKIKYNIVIFYNTARYFVERTLRSTLEQVGCKRVVYCSDATFDSFLKRLSLPPLFNIPRHIELIILYFTVVKLDVALACHFNVVCS